MKSKLRLLIVAGLLLSGSLTIFDNTNVFEVKVQAANAYVQSRWSDGGSTTSVTNSGTFTAGNLIACVVIWIDTTNTLTSVTDGGSNTYTLVNNNTNGAGGGRISNAYAMNIAGFTGTITGTFSGAALWSSLQCHEVSGAATTGALDKSTAGGVNTSSTATDAVTITGVTTTANGEYVIAALVVTNGNTAAAGTNYTQRISNNGVTREFSEDQIQSSAGAIAPTFTASGAGSTNWQIGMMTFFAAGGGGAAATYRRGLLLGVGP
jgi:hypothetical protein